MLTTAAKTMMRGTLNAAKKAVQHLIAHKVASTMVDAGKKRKRLDIDAKHTEERSFRGYRSYYHKRSRWIWYCIGLNR